MQNFNFYIHTCFWNIEYLNCSFSMLIEYALFLDNQFCYFNVVNNVIKEKLWIFSNINNSLMVLIVQNG